MVDTLVLSFLPLILIVAAATLIRRRSDPEKAGRRFFLFLAVVAFILLAVVFLNDLLPPGARLLIVAVPILPGVLALVALRGHEFRGLPGREKALLLLALVFLLLIGARSLVARTAEGAPLPPDLLFIGVAFPTIALFLALAWRLGKRHPAALALPLLAFLLLFNGLGMAQLPLPAEAPPSWRPLASAALYLVLPGLVVAAVSILVGSGFRLIPSTVEISKRSARWRLLLAVILLLAFYYTFAWLWVWDGTDDGVRVFAVIVLGNVTAIGAALVFTVSGVGRARWLGLAFPVLLGSSMIGAMDLLGETFPQPTDQVTEARAARIQHAIEQYQERAGSYPAELAELVPRHLLRILPPVIIPGEEWCYEGGADFYRLGAIYRQHWSAPSMTTRIYASAGDVPGGAWSCEERLAELQPRSDLRSVAPAPPPVSRAPQDASGGPIRIEPLLAAPSFVVGDWSPDGAYLVFGLTAYFDAQTEIDIRFLDATTGAICRASRPAWTAGERSDALTRHHAWLPDGRLLYVSEAGEMVAMTPCAEAVEALSSRFAPTFTELLSADEGSGQMLLRSEDGFWLLDGAGMEARKLAGITPADGESREWAWYAWSPDGERLAISMMDGPEAEMATLTIVDVATADVTTTLPLGDASATNIAAVEWLTPDKLLVHSGFLEIDLATQPPRITDLLREVFLLDVSYPDDFSSVGTLPNPTEEGYYLGLRLNHPRNRALYLYNSSTGEVDIFEHETHTLLFFPGGEWMPLSMWEDDPSYRDEYEMVWIEQPGETGRLKVEGHTPREHPQIFPQYLPSSSQLAVSSSQGVSLVSIPSGETVAFWELAGGGGYGSRILPAPGGEALVVVASGDGLYYIPLPPNE